MPFVSHISEFEKRDFSWALDEYVHKRTVSTILGELPITFTLDKGLEPDPRYVDAANFIVPIILQHQEKILTLAYEHYLELAKDPDLHAWLARFGVPADLSMKQIPKFIRPSIGISVEGLNGVGIGPEWEVEHGLGIVFFEGEWVIYDDAIHELQIDN